MKKLAVLVSGTGSLCEAMINDGVVIGLVLADRACRGLEIANKAGVPTELLRRKDFGSKLEFRREDYTRNVTGILLNYDIDFIAMAGFMTVFDKFIFTYYKDKILNSHPALLPSFKGDNAVADALAYGVKVTGCTIHIATDKLDDGRILRQEAVSVLDGDDREMLHERIKQVERRLYPVTIREFAETIQ